MSNNIKILFDHQKFSEQTYGGISRYFSNIIWGIKKTPDINYQLGVLYSPNHYIESEKQLLNTLPLKNYFRKIKHVVKWNKYYCEYLIGKNDFDILHPTYYDPYFLKKLKKPYVITVHDMIHERFPEYFSPDDLLPKHKRICLENASHIIAISASTKKDLIEFLGIEEKRITVIQHGLQPILPLLNVNVQQENRNYLLYIGDRASYKNFSRFASSISPILLENKDLSLICAGGGVLKSAEEELLLRLKIRSKVSQINATDQQLAQLYQNALVFVFPSLYEGFGLPILEAFQNKCPIVASNTNCFREIGGNAIEYFDPLDEHSILMAIKNVIYDQTRANKLREKGREQLLNFSMEKCVHKTIEIYKSVV